MNREPLTPQALAADVLMFVGTDYQSVATAFLDGDDVLLVDSLGSIEDARAMQRRLCQDMGKTVRAIVATHFMSDHIAGMQLFPDALTIAHRHYRQSFLAQNRRVDAFYREPQVRFDATMTLRWGRHELDLVHNPGKTVDHVSVDVPDADLVCVGDNIVGNIVYLSRADPALVRNAICRIRQFGRGTVVGGHMGRFPAATLDNAIHYLDRLQAQVVRIRTGSTPGQADAQIASIAIADCVAPGVVPSDFERQWHQHNLEAIQAQSIFALDAALASRETLA